MLNSHNVDISDAAKGTASPFEDRCELRLNHDTLPAGSIIGACIQCSEEYVPPVRIGYLRVDPSAARSVEVMLVDAYNRHFCSCFMAAGDESDRPVSGLLLDSHGLPCGQLGYLSATAPTVLYHTALDYNDIQGQYVTGADDFVFRPECCTCDIRGHCKSITVNGDRRLYGKVRLTGGDQVILSEEGAIQIDGLSVRPVRMDLNGPERPHGSQTGWCLLEIDSDDLTVDGVRATSADLRSDPIWIAGTNLTLRSSLESNLRVVRNGYGLSLKGVLDGK